MVCEVSTQGLTERLRGCDAVASYDLGRLCYLTVLGRQRKGVGPDERIFNTPTLRGFS